MSLFGPHPPASSQAAAVLASITPRITHRFCGRALFNDDAEVIAQTVLYLRVVPLSYIAFGVALLVASMFNALGMPLKATALAALRLVALAIPLAWTGSTLFGLVGLFGGIVAANVIMGIVAWGYAHRTIGHLRDELAKD